MKRRYKLQWTNGHGPQESTIAYEESFAMYLLSRYMRKGEWHYTLVRVED